MLKRFAEFALVSASIVACAGSCAEPAAPGGRSNVIWRVPSGTPDSPLVPAANAERSMVYFGTADHRMKKIRGSDGAVVWDVPIGSTQTVYPGMGAVVAGDVVALSLTDVFAFDTTTGQRRWVYAPANLEETGDSPLAANESTVFAASRAGRLHAIDSRTGAARWIIDLAEGKPNVGTLNPTLDHDLVFVCSRDFNAIPPTGRFWAVDAASGAIRWSRVLTAQFNTQGSSCYGSPAIWHDLVIQPAEDGRIFALDRASGAIRWIAPMIPRDSASAGNDHRWAVVGGDVVIATSVVLGGSVIGYDAATGVEHWRHTEFAGSLFLPATDGSAVYVDHGWIFASYDVASGALRWANPTSEYGNPATVYKGTPIIASDRIFVAGRDGSYALRR